MSSTRTPSVLAVLRRPGAALTFTTATIGQSSYALVFLPLLYAVTNATGSIAWAGTAVAAYGAGASFFGPVRAWFIDRFGARRVLPLLVLLFSTALAAIGCAAQFGGSGALLIALAAWAGLVAPPLGPTMRVAWDRITADDAEMKQALSFDTVIEEVLYLAGPAISGVLLAMLSPGTMLLICAALVLVGGLAFAMSAVVGTIRPDAPHAAAVPTVRSRLFSTRFIAVLLAVFVAGTASGTISVAVPSLLAEHGGSAAAGVALGLFAGGSAVGGLVFGALTVGGGALRQVLVLTTGLVMASSVLALCAGAVPVAIVLAGAGLFFSPVMIVGYLAAHQSAAPDRQNSATTWVNTGLNLGSAGASAAAGWLIHAMNPNATVVIMAAAGVLVLVVAALTAIRR